MGLGKTAATLALHLINPPKTPSEGVPLDEAEWGPITGAQVRTVRTERFEMHAMELRQTRRHDHTPASHSLPTLGRGKCARCFCAGRPRLWKSVAHGCSTPARLFGVSIRLGSLPDVSTKHLERMSPTLATSRHFLCLFAFLIFCARFLGRTHDRPKISLRSDSTCGHFCVQGYPGGGQGLACRTVERGQRFPHRCCRWWWWWSTAPTSSIMSEAWDTPKWSP